MFAQDTSSGTLAECQTNLLYGRIKTKPEAATLRARRAGKFGMRRMFGVADVQQHACSTFEQPTQLG